MRPAFILLLCLPIASLGQPPLAIIPRPVAVERAEGSFPLGPELTIAVASRELGHEGEFLKMCLEDGGFAHPRLKTGSPGAGRTITLSLAEGTEWPAEGYRLTITPERVDLMGADPAGAFHGVQTLMQLLPMTGTKDPSIPCLTITDHPRFPWRGMHLDVGRHFFPVDFIKHYVDLLARYKMNTFHWHLTDDQGWRVEIKRYPKLTEVGAWRDGSMIGPYSDQRFDNERYGGFYTQEQIREVVAYAAERHITIVPEIEMPGHALAALAAYPELACTGGPFEVAKGWGIFEDVFCPKEETFTFLENVLSEVIDLFPGEYIHIGGDECPKTRWKECVQCQALMRKEGLKDEHELQSYFIRRIETFVNSKGRKIIGWDEILEGGLAPNAAVMSWRGTAGGIAAARDHHNVVMSPGTHCYFDHYQGDPAQEPLAWGGYNTLQNVYSYEPIPMELEDSLHHFILGAQGNLWTEYLLTPEQIEYMAVPRMLALSEVLWSPKEVRDEADFISRLETEFKRLDVMGVNYSRSLYNVGFSLAPASQAGAIEVSTSCSAPGGTIRYTLDGSDPDDRSAASSGSITLSESVTIKAAFFREATPVGRITLRDIHFNLATAQRITCDPPPNERYAMGGPFTLVDGVTAGPRRVNYEWLGWVATEKPVTITVDLGEVKDFHDVSIGTLDETWSWIHLPEQVEIAVSENAKTYEPFEAHADRVEGSSRVEYRTKGNMHGRYIRFSIHGVKNIPDGLPGAGKPAWIFLDEIEVR